MKILGIIPARYASSRFPGKPLIHIEGKSMVQRVYEQAKKAIDQVIIATDDIRIKNHVLDFGAEAIITSNKLRSGTERCAEALRIFFDNGFNDYDVVVNVQGDEPLINPYAIKLLINAFEDKNLQIATLINENVEQNELEDPNVVKVVTTKDNYALYFSRFPIPYIRDKEIANKIKFYKHIGIYAFRPQILLQITQLEPSNLEIAESLEQNRWLEYGYRIKTLLTDYQSVSIDTPKDLEKLLKILRNNNQH